jgi:hypothetical protein
MEELLSQFMKTLLPSEIYYNFNIVSLTEHSHGYEMRLEELREIAPCGLSSVGDIVLDGFCNPIELLHFSIKGKPLYLKIFRRRWKASGSSRHYSNHYNLHPDGVKATHEFASFLKGEVGCTADEYVRFLLGTES